MIEQGAVSRDGRSCILVGMIERRMREAIIAVGSIWYTAWVDAGQPDLSSLTNTPPSAELLKELVRDFHRRQRAA